MTTIVATSRYTGLVLAIHPNSRGFGWVLFENAHTPVAWSLVHGGTKRKNRLFERFKYLLDRYEPRAFVLQEFENCVNGRSDKTAHLCHAMRDEAEGRGIETPIFDREAIQLAFSKFGASSRSEITQVIATHIDAFNHRLPRRRKLGDSEDTRQSLFDAAALAITYFTYRGDVD